MRKETTMEKCQRCGRKNFLYLTMSYFNTQMICEKCEDKERQRSDFEKARTADEAAVKKGNYNFEGIGL